MNDLVSLDQLRERNLSKLNDLKSQGAGLDPIGVFYRRIELLVDTLLPPDSLARYEFEINYETQMSEVLDQALSEVRKMKLTDGVINSANDNLMQKLLRPGR